MIEGAILQGVYRLKLVFIRHGDPDYERDSLTETGWKEAELAAKRVQKMSEKGENIKTIYVSSLGRAKDTASCSLKALGREDAIVCEWLKEFPTTIFRPDAGGEKIIAWDWLPQDWTKNPVFYDADAWKKEKVMAEAGVDVEYERVCTEFDTVLKKHGYIRCDASEGYFYHAESPNNDTLLFFCHFGIECVLLSHLIHCSPMILWHNFCAVPSSVTTVITEERRRGIASFRINQFGDISHLYAAGEEPSFAARFCECYENEGERRD